jgi:hypothetical protein
MAWTVDNLAGRNTETYTLPARGRAQLHVSRHGRTAQAGGG